MRIGELARRTGVSRRLLRYYEEQGLLTPRRAESGYREYGEDAPLIVGQVRAMLAAGLGTDVIRALLPCAHGPAPTFDPCPGAVTTLRREQERLSSRIAALTEMRRALNRYLDDTRCAARCSA